MAPESGECRPDHAGLDFFSFSSASLANFGLVQPRPGQAGLALWPRLPHFFHPLANLAQGHAHPGRALAPVYPSLAGFLMQGWCTIFHMEMSLRGLCSYQRPQNFCGLCSYQRLQNFCGLCSYQRPVFSSKAAEFCSPEKWRMTEGRRAMHTGWVRFFNIAGTYEPICTKFSPNMTKK